MSQGNGRASLEPRPGGVARAAVLLALVLAGLLAYLDNLPWVLLLIYSGLLLVGLAAVWSWWCGRHLHLYREASCLSQVAGEQLVERFTLRNDSGLPIRLVEVRDLSLAGGARACRAVSLGPRQIVTWETSRRVAVRGRYLLGPTELRLADPCRLFRRRLVFSGAEQLVVHPQLVAISGRSLPGARDDRPQAERRLGAGPRDPRDLLILLDLCRAGQRGGAGESSLEYAVTVAASVAHAALGQGRAVALAASGETPVQIPAGRGEIHYRNLLDYLAVAEADGGGSFAELVRRRVPAFGRRGELVLVTADRSSDWIEALAASSQRGERALAVFLDPVGAGPGRAAAIPAQWRLVADLWVVRHADDLSRLDTRHGKAVV